MAREWTDAQWAAIENTDRTLLVSAAAGSGKTATLTERIIRTVLEGKASISDMLIVTFTNAAVRELKERIGAAVRLALKENPKNARLERELLMLPAAKISTIDSYCGEIVRANAEGVGISPSYRIMDGAEAELLLEGLLDGMISAVYDGQLPEVATPVEFEALCDCLTDVKNQAGIIDSIKYVYRKTMNTEGGVASLGNLIENYRFDGGVEDTHFGKYAIDRLSEFVAHYRRILLGLREEYLLIDGTEKLCDCIAADLSVFDSLLSSGEYRVIREAVHRAEFGNTPSKKGLSGAVSLTPVRKMMKEEFSEIKSRFFTYGEEQWRSVAAELYEKLSVLYRFISEFDKTLRQEKIRRDAFEHSDVERFAYECLWQNGKKTDLAKSLAKTYAFVYIDEYQDVNTIQAKIFEAVSGENNCFMVGDIKQSIYGFRNANPALFAEKKSSFVPLGDAREGDAASIFMSSNFRSDRGVIDFTNAVFDRIFPLFSKLGYEKGDALIYKKPNEDGVPYRKPRVVALCHESKEETEGEELPAWETDSAALVAKKISELLAGGKLNSGEEIRPEDIAILLRSKTHAAEYARELEALGIPAFYGEEKSFFTNSDVLLALSLLYAIDNPRRDTQLCGLMCSPLFGFTPDELVKITKEGEGEYLYDKLISFAEGNPDFEKGKKFLLELQRLRILASTSDAAGLLARLYRQTGLLAVASGGDGEGRLMKLYDHARDFGKNGGGGLSSFLSYINKIIDRDNSFDEESPKSEGCVKIQTIHSSKGLEYPVVFLAEAQSAFKGGKSTAEHLSYDEGFGISMRLRTPAGLSRVNNPMRWAVVDYIERRDVEEEARTLYVALTRAREQLYVVAKPQRSRERLEERAALTHAYLSSYSVFSLTSFLDLILAATGIVPETAKELIEGEETYEKTATAGERIEACDGCDDGLYRLLIERFNFEYPDKYLTELPEKLSVSRLYPEVLDGTEAQVEIYPAEDEAELNVKGALPSFITGIEKKSSAKRGIATHLFMQFCDIERLQKLGCEAELDRLEREKFISKRDRERVRTGEVELFCKSDLIKEMASAKRIHRELRFNVKLPAELFTTEEKRSAAYEGQEILVQGVIDCLIEDGCGGLHLVDYKTDRLGAAEMENPSLAEEKLRSAHSLQLSYYAMAIERIFGKKPDTVRIYSLPLGRTVDVIL